MTSLEYIWLWSFEWVCEYRCWFSVCIDVIIALLLQNFPELTEENHDETHIQILGILADIQVRLLLNKFHATRNQSPSSRNVMVSLKTLYIHILDPTRKSDSSVGIALGYGLDDRGSRFRFLAGAGNFSLHHRVQNGSGAPSASYSMGTRGSFPGGKAAGSWSWPLTSI
jgi:hypothetical protein